MTVSNLGGWYMALSSDEIDGKVPGASRIGAPIYFVDTFEWKQVGDDEVVHDFYGFPAQIVYPIESNGGIPVSVQDQYSSTVDLYLMDEDYVTPSITSPIELGDTTIAIDDNTGVVGGDAVYVHDDERFFQSIVSSSTENEIVLASSSDAPFGISASLEVGAWNMAVDGSVAEKTFSIHPPLNSDFDIYAITLSGLDDLSMDSTTFIGIVDGISTPLVIRHIDGGIKNIGMFTTNLGFEEQGYVVEYQAANKHSEYGIRARKNFRTTNGVSVRLVGSTEDKIQAVIGADLSSQSQLAIIIHGHVVTN